MAQCNTQERLVLSELCTQEIKHLPIRKATVLVNIIRGDIICLYTPKQKILVGQETTQTFVNQGCSSELLLEK